MLPRQTKTNKQDRGVFDNDVNNAASRWLKHKTMSVLAFNSNGGLTVMIVTSAATYIPVAAATSRICKGKQRLLWSLLFMI